MAKDPEGCGECGPCEENNYDPENPETHCIDCTCFLCIPGN